VDFGILLSIYLRERKGYQVFIMQDDELGVCSRFHFGIRKPAIGLMGLFSGTTM